MLLKILFKSGFDFLEMVEGIVKNEVLQVKCLNLCRALCYFDLFVQL